MKHQIRKPRSSDLRTRQDGSAVVIVLLFLSLMTLIGIWGTRNANTEIAIAGNEVRLKRTFYRAEAAVLEAAFMIESEISDNLKDHSSLDWLWNAVGGPPNDLSTFANWDFDTLDGDDTAFETTLDLDGDGNPDATAAFAVHDRGAASGSSLVMTNTTTVRSYSVFGLQDSNEGRAIIEVGYKKRI
ncbi:MAG: hypothetical protein PVF97_01575 [Desulfobacterales bacterium]